MFTNYKFYTTRNQVIAISTFAGKTVRGIAKCSPNDSYDLEKGKKLAAARCAVKIAEKRMKRACHKHDEAKIQANKAMKYATDMCRYEQDSIEAFNKASFELENLESTM